MPDTTSSASGVRITRRSLLAGAIATGAAALGGVAVRSRSGGSSGLSEKLKGTAGLTEITVETDKHGNVHIHVGSKTVDSRSISVTAYELAGFMDPGIEPFHYERGRGAGADITLEPKVSSDFVDGRVTLELDDESGASKVEITFRQGVATSMTSDNLVVQLGPVTVQARRIPSDIAGQPPLTAIQMTDSSKSVPVDGMKVLRDQTSGGTGTIVDEVPIFDGRKQHVGVAYFAAGDPLGDGRMQTDGAFTVSARDRNGKTYVGELILDNGTPTALEATSVNLPVPTHRLG